MEDKLARDQRIRLESLALASAVSPPGMSSEFIIDRAKRYESYISKGAADE